MKKIKLWSSGLASILVIGLLLAFSSNPANGILIPNPDEELKCADLLEDVSEIKVRKYLTHGTIMDTTITQISTETIDYTDNPDLFLELINILNKYILSPVETEKYPTDISFYYDVYTEEDYYRNFPENGYLTFNILTYTENGDKLNINLSGNGNLYVSRCTVHHRTDGIALLEFEDHYEEKFSLTDNNLELLVELSDFVSNNPE